MSIERDQLLAALPQLFQRAPWAAPAVQLAYTSLDGSRMTAEVRDGVLLLVGLDGAPSAEVPLVGRTMGELVVEVLGLGINGLLAGLEDDAVETVAAEALLDEGPLSLGFELASFPRHGNPNWRLLEPARREVTRASARIDVAIAQLNLLRAAGSFADLWGTFTGTPRRAGETDEAFTARQLRELLRPRDNNVSLALLLEEDFQVAVPDVADLERQVLRWNTTPLGDHCVPGLRYNAAVAEIAVAGFAPRELLVAAREHVAAGVTVFIAALATLDDGAGGFAFDPELPLLVGEPPDMQVGVGAIGVGRVPL